MKTAFWVVIALNVLLGIGEVCYWATFHTWPRWWGPVHEFFKRLVEE
jgi:hypothetical protein